jgi:hypothetical protein
MDKLLDLLKIENINIHTEKTIVNSFVPGLYDIIMEYENIPFQMLGIESNQEKYPGLGWFYPLYLRPTDEPYHVHNISSGTETVTCYMPNGNMNHASGSQDGSLPVYLDIVDRTPVLRNPDRLIELIKNIKYDLYQRKTTKECITNFFKTLFGNDAELTVTTSSNCSVDLVISGVDISLRDYSIALYEEFLEPVGTVTTYTVSSSSLRVPSNEEEYAEQRRAAQDPKGVTLTAFEMTVIGNYDVYHLNDISTIPAFVGCNDGSPAHPRGITLAESNVPAYTHPNWSKGISGGTSFGNINIFDFILLPFKNNPNYGITSCAFL